ncbi:condensation domain-containing protein [Streptomyces lydicus]|nr:condensation domain-containing protein [Streptomyces lydicus]
MVELHPETDEAALRQALTALTGHHEALRHRFVREDGAWHQYATPPRSVDVLRRHDLSALEPCQRAAAMDKLAAAADAGLDLAAGELFAALLFVFGPGERPTLFLTAHHLVVDGVSWRILLADLEAGYVQARDGKPVSLGAPGSSFGQWAHRLAGHVADGGLDGQAAYWQALPPATDIPATAADRRWSSRCRPSRWSCPRTSPRCCCAGPPGCSAPASRRCCTPRWPGCWPAGPVSAGWCSTPRGTAGRNSSTTSTCRGPSAGSPRSTPSPSTWASTATTGRR